MLRNLLATLIAVVGLLSVSFSQVGQGGLKGRVLDASTGEPLPFVNIIIELNGAQVTGGATDFDGKYFIKPIPPGSYTLKASFTGYKPQQVNGIVIRSEKTEFYDVKLESTVIAIEEFEVVEYSVPLISKDNTTSGGTVTREDINRMPGRSAASVAQTVGGVYSKDDGSGDLNIRGSRSDANYYFIDGIKVRGSTNLPQSAIEQVSVLLGGIPAQYGDVTGGVISITTRGPSSQYFGSLEYVTSGYKFGEQIYGLDNYGYNLLEYSISGPVLFKKDSAGNKTKPLFGFFLSGNVQSVVDPRPSSIGVWTIKDESLDALIADPLRAGAGDAAIQNADFLRLNNLEKIRTNQNIQNRGLSLAGKIDVTTSATTNLTFGGTINWNRRNVFNYGNQLLNFDNNAQRTNSTWRVYTRFTQRFGSNDPAMEQKSASNIKNAFYTIQADYTHTFQQTWDETHKDDMFRYGYYGQFRTFQQPAYGVGADSLTGVFGNVQTTFQDVLIGFEPSDINPRAAAYTQRYYALNGWLGYDENGNPQVDPSFQTIGANGPPLSNIDAIRSGGGYINGDEISNIYNMWNNPAADWNQFAENVSNQFRITTTGSADIKDHSFTLGFEYEQRVDKGYNSNPRGLWTQARLRTNTHITNLDRSNPVITYPGPQIDYQRLNAAPGPYSGTDEQSFFDFNLRRSLGLNPDGIDFVDVNSYRPEDLDIEFFSADELLNDGNNLVSYFGYDPYGNRSTDNPSFDDFFTARDEFGNLTRPVDAFRPIYVAGFIQDKFSFDDLVFNVGVRVDRFDANQNVLIDPFVIFPTVKAGEAEAEALLGETSRPSNIGDDFVVYVDNITNPSAVLGYRDGETWYNASGSQIEDATALRTASGTPAPLLVDKERTNSTDLTSASFEDYTPQTNFMPRIAFSFPISDEALFFAHYDVLTQRPSGVVRMNPFDYLFLQNTSNNVLNNPNLQPQRTIDYELGFQQKLTNSSSLKLAAFYRELRDQLQIVNVVDAYPRTYITYGNIDFGTVKGLTVSYDLRRTGNIWMRAAYTLQFAEGTGSTSTSGINLAATGNQTLRTTLPLSYDQRHAITATFDYRYGAGKDYNGPIWFGKQVFANTGANFVMNAGSGEPYSGQSNVTPTALFSSLSSVLDGQINGSRLPWQFRIDARFDRDIEMSLGKEDKKRDVQLNLYLQVLNLLNSQNTVNVYRATGNANDDGYLAAPEFQSDIAAANNEQSFRELYTVKLNNPGNFNFPRQIRVGALLNF